MSTASSPTNLVLISGANQRLGFETVRQLSKFPGYHILLGSRDLSKGEEAARKISQESGVKSKVSPIELDVSSDESIQAVKKEVEEKYAGGGGLDILVNNAGIALDGKSKDLSVRELMRTTYEVNVFGAAALTEAFTPLLMKTTFPRIVNISSTLGSIQNGLDKDSPSYGMNLVGYSTSKSALNALTVCTAKSIQKGRTVSLCPGYNATNLNNYQGTNDPKDGVKIILRAITEGESSDLKSGYFYNAAGPVSW